MLIKLAGRQLVDALPQRFGIPLAPIAQQLTTELPRLVLDLKRVDLLYRLTDGQGVHLECQMHLRPPDVLRFITYGLLLLQQTIVPRVLTVVLCGPDSGDLPAPIDLGPTIPYRLLFVRLVDEQADAVLARLQATAAQGGTWTERDRLDLLLLPLMPHLAETEALVRDGLGVALQLPAAWQEQAIGGLLALAYHTAGKAVFNRLVETMRGTTVLDKLLQDEWSKGREEGREEGERAMLRRVVLQRFGVVPPALETRIATAESATLAAFLDRVLAAGSVEELEES